MAAEVPEKKKSKITFLTAYTILALLLVVVALLTFVIPAGKYDTNPTDGAPIPGTYHLVEASPQRLRDAILAPINGMYGIEDVEVTSTCITSAGCMARSMWRCLS